MTSISKLTKFLLFFLPFQFALNIGGDIDLAIIRILILIIFLLFLTLSLYKKTLYIPKNLTALFSFSLLFWTFFSIFYSSVPSWTIRKIIFLVSFSSLFLVLTHLFHQKKENVDKLWKSLVLSTILISFISILQFTSQFIFGLNKMLEIWQIIIPFFLGENFSEAVIEYNSWLVNVVGRDLMRALAFFPDPHIFSFFCGLIAPFSLTLFIRTKKIFWLIGFFIITLANLLTFTRGGYFGLIAGFLVGISLFWNQIKIFYKHFLFSAITLFILFLFIPNNFFVNRFRSSFDNLDNSVNGRFEIWQEAWEIGKNNWLLGVGLGAYSNVVNPRADYRMPIYAHNLYLDIWAELGLIGLFFFFGLLTNTFLTFYKNRRKTFPKFAIISLVTFLTHSLFDTAIFSVHIFPVFVLIISLNSFYADKNSKSKKL